MSPFYGLFTFLLVVSCLEENPDFSFSDYITQFGKNYASEEYQFR